MANGFRDPDPGGFGLASNPDLTNPVKRTRFQEFTSRTGPFANIGAVGHPSDTDILFKEQQRLQQQAVGPAIRALESQRPTTEAAFGERERRLTAEREPLKARYQSILDEITRREGVEKKQISTTASREFGRRGIPLSSTAFAENLQERLTPTSQFFTGQLREAGLEQAKAERDLENLISRIPIERQQALDAITQSIAQLQAGGGQQAITNALQLFQSQQAQRQFQEQQSLAERAQSFAEKQASQPSPTQLSFVKSGSQVFGVDPFTGEVKTTLGGGGGVESGSNLNAIDFLNLLRTQAGGAPASFDLPSSFIPD